MGSTRTANSSDVKKLVNNGIEVFLQPSPIRIFSDKEYIDVGASISEDLSSCPLILGVKEIPINFIEEGKSYVFFSHTIKGQDYNMPLLQAMMDKKTQLIDYERIVDEKGRRLIFFGRHAGLAGMIDSLWALGQRLDSEGIKNPFSKIKKTFEYRGLENAKKQIWKLPMKSRGMVFQKKCVHWFVDLAVMEMYHKGHRKYLIYFHTRK